MAPLIRFRYVGALQGETPTEIARSFNVSHSTISRLARRKAYIEGASAASFENSSGE
jgi:hypothetical protein